jgi:D-arabinitol dehydrogenase (NADP+)
MKAVVYSAPREYQITDIPVPEPGPADVRIRCRQVGLCGTDVHIHNGEFMAEFPLIPGHELDGTVDALGADVTGFVAGEQVTVNPNVYCGICAYCRAGRLILCANLKGMGSNYPGFFAEYVTVPAALVFSTEGLPPDVAVFSEPAACAMHGLENLDVRPGSSALVLGAGPTGLLLAQFLATGGAASVTVAAPSSHKLETAARLGLDRTVLITRGDPDGSLGLLRAASPGGDGYDYVVEATGSAEVGAMCVPLTRNGGTVLVYGVTGHADTVAFHPFDVFRREITIKGSFAEITSFAAAIAALKGGRARTDGIITHRFGLDDYPAALQAVAGGTGVHKVVIECS